jgi:chemotaxis protein histidine kinase CheA
LPPSSQPEVVQAEPSQRLRVADTVRLPMSRLDELIKLMGEVVSSHARLRQRVVDIRAIERLPAQAGKSLPAFSRALKDDVLAQDLLMQELHRKALVMRMLPLAMVFETAPRMVRDLARSVGKDIECVISGAEIELDRQLIDRLSDPIVHLLRNAVDHGIEAPAIREKLGKPKIGRIQLRARPDSGGVVIEVVDDGGGVALSSVRDKAVRKGVMTAEQVAALSEAEVVDLIFRPGFSTSAIITEVSGRGVGMDVVKRCIVDELQGSVAVESKSGHGVTFALHLPRSLAVMRVLLVEAGGEIFGFTAPQVTRLLRLPAERLLLVAERPVVVVENEFVPMVSLADLLSLPKRQAPSGDDLLLVMVQVHHEKLALRVDDWVDERDMVIKPLPDHLAHVAMVSGMVMTGRSALVSVLQTPILLEMARQARVDSVTPEEGAPRERSRVLVVDDSLNTREIERDVLEAHGYQVTLAEDGRDGLHKALGGAFDVVLTDVEMPQMDGFALTAALRQDERYRHVPIIIITSRQKEEDKRRGIEVGADAYIVKGDFDQGGLIATLKSLLG